MSARLPYSKYHLNDRPRFLKLSRSQREGHLNKCVIASRNLIRQTGCAELKQFQFEMANVFFIVRLDITLAAIEGLKLTLNQHVRFAFLEWGDLLAISIVGIKKSLVVVTTHNGRYSFGCKLHDESLSDLT
jgi:hypothetical protein